MTSREESRERSESTSREEIEIRERSRTRVQRDFFPHYLDDPLLFPSRCAAADKPGTWPSAKLDYVLLSALSSSPNQLFYMPTKSAFQRRTRQRSANGSIGAGRTSSI